MLRRPIIRISLTNTDVYLELATLIALITFWIIINHVYKLSPEIIPSHFTSDGKVDGYGNKDYLYELPRTATILYVIITVVSFFPHLFNYFTTITVANAERQYTTAVRSLRVLKLIIVLIFFSISILVIRYIESFKNTNFAALYLIAISIFILITLYFIYKQQKAK